MSRYRDPPGQGQGGETAAIHQHHPPQPSPSRADRECQGPDFDSICVKRIREKQNKQSPASHLAPGKPNKTVSFSQAQIKAENPISICNYI